MKKNLLNPYLWLCFLPLELTWIWCCTKLNGDLKILAIITTVIGITWINIIALRRTY
jgi:hypothetical protein